VNEDNSPTTAQGTHSGFLEKTTAFYRVGKNSCTRKAKRDFTWSKEGRNLEQFISTAGALSVPLLYSFPTYLYAKEDREREKPNGKQPKPKHFLPVSVVVPETT